MTRRLKRRDGRWWDKSALVTFGLLYLFAAGFTSVMVNNISGTRGGWIWILWSAVLATLFSLAFIALMHLMPRIERAHNPRATGSPSPDCGVYGD